MKFRLLPLLILVTMVLATACSDDDNSNNTVNPNYDITITNYVPTSGPVGSTVKIKGSNFGTDPSELTIKFGGVEVVPDTVTDTEILIRVPAEMSIGDKTITVQRMDGKIKTLQFTVEDPIVGVWVSENSDVAPLLYGPPFNIRKIEATFKADNSYIVVQTDSSGYSGTLTGTYATEGGAQPAPNENIRIITVYQGSPTSLTAEGIYEVTVGESEITMKYEIAQTEPPLTGVTKPTPEGGFGSTSGGAIGTINVQHYVKID